MDIERKNYLPIQREISKPNRNYQHQLGFSATSRDHFESKPELNNSLKMKSTLNYESSKSMKKFTCFDDFKYNSRK